MRDAKKIFQFYENYGKNRRVEMVHCGASMIQMIIYELMYISRCTRDVRNERMKEKA